MDAFVKKLSKALGEEMVPVPVKAGGKKYEGWRADKRRRSEDATDLVMKHGAEASSSNVRLFAGDPDLIERPYSEKELKGGCYVPIVAVPELPVLDIVEFSKVGTGGMSEPRNKWKEVREGLSKIYSAKTFEIRFADSCGLHAYFDEKMSKAEALLFAKIIEEIDPYFVFVLDQRPMSDLILKERKFILFWEK